MLAAVTEATKWYVKLIIRRIFPLRLSTYLLGDSASMYHLWSIGICIGASPQKLHLSRTIANPVLSRQEVTDVRALFVADPFLVQTREAWHMFFEVYNFDSDRGEIGWATSDNGFAWSYQHIVLRESFHLSYPYVFQWKNGFYMIPEAHQSKSVRLYEAREFPTSWVCIEELLTGRPFNDSSLLYHDNHWWLWSETDSEMRFDTLRLYYASDLRGPWKEHPKSPIIRGDPKIARPAGRVIVTSEGIVRFAQDCALVYGAKVRAFKITELTTTTYQEQPLLDRPLLGPNPQRWAQGGMHHVDPHRLSRNEWIAAVDGWRPVGWLVPDGWTKSQC